MKKADLQRLILEAYEEVLSESLLDEVEDEPQPEEEPNTEAPKETVLEDATDQILAKFPTLKAAIVKLQTEDFKEFVDSIDWISPRPTSFRVNLKNGQDYILKWTGKSFEAQILGKRYLLSNIAEYQQALDKLAILYKEAPLKGAGEGEEFEPSDSGAGGGGGGDTGGGGAGGFRSLSKTDATVASYGVTVGGGGGGGDNGSNGGTSSVFSNSSSGGGGAAGQQPRNGNSGGSGGGGGGLSNVVEDTDAKYA